MPIETPGRSELNYLYDEFFNLNEPETSSQVEKESKAESDKPIVGKDNNIFLEVVSEDPIAEHIELLKKIITATGLETESVTIFDNRSLNEVLPEMSSGKRLIFQSSAAGEVQQLKEAEIQYIKAPSLHLIDKNRELKIQLWGALKELFQIK